MTTADDALIDRFVRFLNDSPTPNHAVAAAITSLEAHGFTEVDLGEPPNKLPVGHRGYVAKGGSLIAFHVGSEAPVEAGFRVVAAHTDSPNLRLKPLPLMRSHGYVRLGVEVYGGVLLATWLDRDLGIAGLVTLRDGPLAVRQELVHLTDPICRIPNIAIHLNRTVNTDGLKVNAQTQLPAIFALDHEDLGEDPLRDRLAAQLGCDARDILTWDLSLVDATPAVRAGAHGEFVHSGRLDNLGSCHAGLEALIASVDGETPGPTSVLALFDHEEVGSTTSRGADSRTLEEILRLIQRHAAVQATGTFSRALAHSLLVSADMAHAVHPAHAEMHDPAHMPMMNAGPVIKQNASQRYGTEGETSALFQLLCESVDVPVQWFVNRADLACGSTVGPILASRLGVRTVDVGVAMLSMHSAREMCGALDQPRMAKVLGALFRGEMRV